MADVNGTEDKDFIHFRNEQPPVGYNDIPYTISPVPGAIHGNGGDDIIYGYAAQVFGDDGDDEVYARGLSSTVYDGGAGFDTLWAQGGTLHAVNFEQLKVSVGSRTVLVADALQAGQTLVVDGAWMSGSSGRIQLDASAFVGQVQFIIKGGSNRFVGSANGDTVDIQTGTKYGSTLAAGAGNDTFNLVGTSIVDPKDSYLNIDGGTGNDKLTITGDYSDPSSFATLKVSNVERVELGAGFDYVLVAPNDLVATGRLLTVSATALGAANILDFDGSAETNGKFNLQGGQGDDRLVGGGQDDILVGYAGDDTLDISAGGADIARGGDGDDYILAGTALTGADRIDGGAGLDVVALDGTYKALSINAQTLVNIEVLSLARGYRYTLSSGGSGFGNKLLTVDGSALGAADRLDFDGRGEQDGRLRLYGGAAGDRLAGGALNDTIAGGLGNDALDLSAGGADTADGDNGDDTFRMGAALDAKDRLDGGTGVDTVSLSGAYSNLVLTGAMLNDIERVELGAGFDYGLRVSESLLAGDEMLRVDGRSLGVDDVLTFDGTAERDGGRFNLLGGAGNDVLHGGSSYDSLTGGGGADFLYGYGDRLVYLTVADSTGPNYDTVFGYTGGGFKNFVFPDKIVARDPNVTTGTLSTETFNSDLGAAIGADQLGVGHAVRFTASAGSLAGQTFLIADANGVAGYQANEDYVIRLA